MKIDRRLVSTYSGNPGGKPIYPNAIDHGYGEPLAGGTDVMRRLQNQLLHEQGLDDLKRPESPRLASSRRVAEAYDCLKDYRAGGMSREEYEECLERFKDDGAYRPTFKSRPSTQDAVKPFTGSEREEHRLNIYKTLIAMKTESRPDYQDQKFLFKLTSAYAGISDKDRQRRDALFNKYERIIRQIPPGLMDRIAFNQHGDPWYFGDSGNHKHVEFVDKYWSGWRPERDGTMSPGNPRTASIEPTQEFIRFLDDNAVRFPSGPTGWWLPAHNLGIMLNRQNMVVVMRYQILSADSYRPGGGWHPPTLEITPRWRRHDLINRPYRPTRDVAQRLLMMAEHTPTVTNSVKAELDSLTSTTVDVLPVVVPAFMVTKMSMGAAKTAIARWGVVNPKGITLTL
jgi:hypothetical protein